MKGNRKYKDSVFTDLFGSDEKSPPKALSLCNALLGTNYTDVGSLHNIRLDNVLYSTLRNDLAYLIDDRLIVMIEHQSTINKNMPLRFLLYIAREYEKIIAEKKRYSLSLQKIPTPEFFVLYNGLEDYPDKKTLKLSDAFEKKKDQPPLELIVHVININATKNVDVLDTCPFLNEYSLFVDEVRKQQAIDKENGYNKAIEICIKKGILKEYLKRKRTEVRNMLIAEYDYATDMAVKQEEAFNLGEKRGKKQGITIGRQEGAYQNKLETARILKHLGDSVEKISNVTGLSIKEIEELE